MARKPNANYTLEQLQKAVDSVKKKEMTCAVASKFHDVPFSTLYCTVRRYGFDTNCKCKLMKFVSLFLNYMRCINISVLSSNKECFTIIKRQSAWSI